MWAEERWPQKTGEKTLRRVLTEQSGTRLPLLRPNARVVAEMKS